MKHLITRQLSRVADSSAALARRLKRRRSRSAILRGHVPVYVGEEMKRFAVSADVVNNPIFAKLLERSAEEYGYHQKGVLRIPCHVSDFELVVAGLIPVGVSDDVVPLIGSVSTPVAGNLFIRIKTYLRRSREWMN